MNDIWTILKQELAFHGIHLINSSLCRFKNKNSELTSMPVKATITQLRQQIKIQTKMFASLWEEVIVLLSEHGTSIVDENSSKLFIFSVKDLAKMADMFEELSGSIMLDTLNKFLDRDITTFSRDAIIQVPSYKISIDWLFRCISRISYIIRLLQFANLGSKRIEKMNIKLARGTSGPWANLDLPMLERVFPWDSVDEETRGRDRDVKRQRRYRMGLEQYHGDGRVNEGFYWRELRNEPFSWYDRDTESPYPGRGILNKY